MNPMENVLSSSQSRTLATNKLIKNTYMLLSASLFFSALMAVVSVMVQTSAMASLLFLIGGMLLGMFVLPRTANSSTGLLVMFAMTGMLGFSLGNMLTYYLHLPNGPQIIATAFGGTGVIFLSLSAYALTTRKDFSFMGGFLMTAFLVILLASIANIFMSIPALSLAISAGVVLIMSAWILFDTSRMVHGHETNYIMAAAGLYISIFNIFVHLLHILGALSGDD